MKKILVRIKGNTLVFKERIKLSNDYKSVINTNIISANELVFSDEYIMNNIKIVTNFLNELINTYSIDTIILENSSFLSLILKLVKSSKVSSLKILDDIPLTYNICEDLTKTNIKNVNCYSLQPFMLEYLDKYGIIVESRNEILFLSNFMLQNNLSKFSSLYYKINLDMTLPLSEQDEQDFADFIRINKYLKIINIDNVNRHDLEFIVKSLKKNNKKNIKIIINNNINDIDTINYLKDFNKRKSNKKRVKFRINYSDDYLTKNIIKQANSNLLFSCGAVILFIIAISFGYVFLDNYRSMKKDNELQEKLSKVINEKKDIVKDINNNDNNEDVLEEETINEDVYSLFQDVNPEVVGWITINNTNIDYPIVQTANNSYYLKHNIYFEDDNNGWVFMDYRDKLDYLSDNIILYAHNRYYSGIMFGTLQNTQRKNWYTNPENQVLTFKTMNKILHYKVFSVYKIKTTTDYLQVLFANNNSKKEFFDMLKDRSLYDFGVEFDGSEKIITLSTCAADDHRNVLHAVLIDE